jgi:cytochrome c553
MNTFACGHAKTPENTRKNGDYTRCKTCHNAQLYRARTSRVARQADERAELRRQLASIREDLRIARSELAELKGM